jgi:hypothetical protein
MALCQVKYKNIRYRVHFRSCTVFSILTTNLVLNTTVAPLWHIILIPSQPVFALSP